MHRASRELDLKLPADVAPNVLIPRDSSRLSDVSFAPGSLSHYCKKVSFSLRAFLSIVVFPRAVQSHGLFFFKWATRLLCK